MPETMPPADPMIVRLPLIKFYRTDDGRVVGEVTGSTLVPPGMTNGRYLSASGYTTDISDATDFRGEAGATLIAGDTVEVEGPKGDPGMNGRSAYELWLEAGNVGSQAVFLDSLKGAKGATGAKGDTGSPGSNGTNGVNGAKGDTGATGPKGDTGAAGPAGQTGPSGSTFLPNISLTDTALVALLAGTRKSAPIACTGAVVGDRLTAHPFQGAPTGYAICDCYCLIANQVIVTYNGPALALLAANTIPLKITAFR